MSKNEFKYIINLLYSAIIVVYLTTIENPLKFFFIEKANFIVSIFKLYNLKCPNSRLLLYST